MEILRYGSSSVSGFSVVMFVSTHEWIEFYNSSTEADNLPDAYLENFGIGAAGYIAT